MIRHSSDWQVQDHVSMSDRSELRVPASTPAAEM